MKHLTAERWHQIDTLFAEVLDRPPDERTAFLRYACGSDIALYEEVVSLLDLGAEAEIVLGESATRYAASLLKGLESELARSYDEALTQVGPYRLLRRVGTGGMGAVYLAERFDGQFEHRVALKLVKRGMDTEDILRRFQNERQILASLQHPNIAQLHDGGAAADGRPYLVMEYVEGAPLDHYCDEHRLAVDRRLELFQTVCTAVQYAHRNLVVHRDLKPSNILVTDDGQVKLLDFGIARLLADDSSPVLTRTGMRVMTPEFAAPEQIEGSAITTATDVYALGVLLYKLLTGHRPYVVGGATPREIESAVLNQNPERPSAVVSRTHLEHGPEGGTLTSTPTEIAAARSTDPKRLKHMLSGDLDTILLKALHKEPARRYHSAEQFLEDIQRHLAGLPVRARPDSLGYRTHKFVRRHFYGVVAASAFAVLLGGSAVALAVQQKATAHERDIARLERDKAEEVAAFLENLLASADPFEQERLDTLRVQDMLDRGTERIQKELGERPLVQAQMLNAVGRVYDRLGRSQQAAELVDQALVTRREILGADHQDVAESLGDLGRALFNQGKYDDAAARLREALVLLQGMPAPPREQVAGAMRSLGMVLEAQGHLDEAEPLLREALAQFREMHGEHHVEVASSLSTLALIAWAQSRYEEAEALLRESLTLRRTLYGDEHPGLALGLHDLGRLLRDQLRYPEAEESVREALSINRRTLGPEHPNVVENLYVLASLLTRRTNYAAADSVFREVLALSRKVHGPEHVNVSITLDSYAALLKARGNYEEAARREREAIAIARKIYGDEHVAVGLTRSKLAGILHASGRHEEATLIYRESLEVLDRLVGVEHLHSAMARLGLGICLTELGHYDEAEGVLRASYRTVHETQDPAGRYVQRVVERLIVLFEAWGKPEGVAEFRALLIPPEASNVDGPSRTD